MRTIITPDGIKVHRVSTDVLSVGSSEVNEFVGNNRPNQNTLPKSIAMYESLDNLQRQITTLQGTREQNVDYNIFSDSFVSENFIPLNQDTDKGWIISTHYNRGSVSNFANCLIYKETNSATNNYLSIPAGRFKKAGKYFLTVHIPQLDSGSVDIVYNESVVETITVEGIHSVQVELLRPTVDNLTIVCKDVQFNDIIAFKSCYVIQAHSYISDYVAYWLKRAFEEYDSSIYITRDEFTNKLDLLKNELHDVLLQHVLDVDPHNQYVLKSEIQNYVTRHEPNMLLDCPLGITDPFTRVRPSILFITPSLNHTSMNDYDAMSGVITCTPASHAKTLYNCVNKAIVESPLLYPRNEFSIESGLVTVKYTFSKKRDVKNITLYLNGPFVTPILSLTLLMDGLTDIVVSNIEEQTSQTVISLPVNASLDAFSIRIDSIIPSSILTKYAFGFDVEFSDCSINSISISPDVIVTAKDHETSLSYKTVLPIAIQNERFVKDHLYAIALRMDGTTDLFHTAPYIGELNDLQPIPVSPLNKPLDILRISRDQLKAYSGLVDLSIDEVIIAESSISYSTDIDLPQALFIKEITLKFSSLNYSKLKSLLVEDNGLVLRVNDTTILIPKIEATETHDVLVTFNLLGILVEKITITLQNTREIEFSFRITNVLFDIPSYDTSTNLWTDGIPRKLLGWIKKNDNGTFLTYSIYKGNTQYQRANDGNPIIPWTYYRIPNLCFNSANVDIVMLQNQTYATIYDDCILLLGMTETEDIKILQYRYF